MNILWDDGDVVFEDLDAFLADLLRRLPEAAATEDEAAQARLFGTPTGGKDPDADAEWMEVVVPDLQELFQSNVDLVSKDLERLEAPEEEEGDLRLRVPGEHLHAWVHTLNQARLALAAKHNISEDDMEGRGRIVTDEKGFAFLQVEIYGVFLQFLLRHTEL